MLPGSHRFTFPATCCQRSRSRSKTTTITTTTIITVRAIPHLLLQAVPQPGNGNPKTGAP
jgi:hypothetical protein